MAVEYDYCVAVLGRNYNEEYGEWDMDLHIIRLGFGKEPYFNFDSYEKAVEFVESITPEQALEWARIRGCDGLDVAIYEEPVINNTYTGDFCDVGNYAWIGDKHDPESDYGIE